jgi:hypothetical protein
MYYEESKRIQFENLQQPHANHVSAVPQGVNPLANHRFAAVEDDGPVIR